MNNLCENLRRPRSMVNVGQPIFVPEDITRTILLLLPVKSLLRLSIVCESWRNIILSDQFKQTHHANNPRRQVVFFSEMYIHGATLPLPSSDESSRLEKMTLSETMQLEKYYRVVGHCNGVICLSVGHNSLIPPTILLWNPALRQCRALPSSTPITYFFLNNMYSVGFGYDPTNRDYKVVMASIGLFAIEMYSLNNNSWKKIPRLERQFIDLSSSGLHFEGRLFWIMDEIGNNGVESCVVFDLVEEKISHFELPVAVRRNQDRLSSPSLGVFRGRASLLRIRDQCECEIWSTEDHCRPECWTKVLTIPVEKFSPSREFLGMVGLGSCCVKSRSIGLTADGENVFMGLRAHDPLKPNGVWVTEKVLLYDVQADALKVHTENARGLAVQYNSFTVMDYVETLVSIMPLPKGIDLEK